MWRRRWGVLAACAVAAVAVPLSSTAATVVLLGTQTIGAQHDSNTAGKAEAFRTTATASGALTTLTVYVDSTSAATKLTAGLYSDAGGHPGTLLGQGTIASPAKGAWDDVAITSANVTAGTTYWIAVLSPSGSGTLQFRDACCAGASETSSASSLTTLAASWTTGSRFSDGPLSAYGSGSTSATPLLQVSPTTLSFSGVTGGSDPGAAQVSVANGGGGTISFTAASDAPWLGVTPASGNAPQTLQVSASLAGLSAGTYTGHVTVTAAGVQGSPATVTVSLVVTDPPPPSPADWTQIDHDSARTGEATGETMLGTSNASALALSWSAAVDGKVTAQPLYVKQVTVAGSLHDVVIAATSANSLYALDASTGAQLWRRNFGAESSNCAIPGGFGVTGAPAIDKASGRVYVVSDDGKLHVLSLADGTDAVTALQLIAQPATNKVWGGLNLSGSDLYVATASDGCDTAPWRGHVYHLGLGGGAPQVLGGWDVVTSIPAPNGGGGIWGYGGVSVGPGGNVYVATGADSNENQTDFANRMVALTGGLSPLGSFAPPEPATFPCAGAPCDLDFGATPLVFTPAGCSTMVAAGNKNGNLYVFDASVLAASGQPAQALQLNPANDWLGSGGVGGVPAYWSSGRTVFVSDVGAGVGTTAGGIVALKVQSDCSLSVAWSAALGGNATPDSTPTVANGVVYVGEGNGGRVHAYDAQTGAALWTSGALGSTFAAPIVADGRLFVGSWNGSNATDAGTIRAYAPQAADTTPPTVSITAPADGSTVSGTVNVTANAADNVAVASVQFKLDGSNLGAADTTSPYSASWDTTTATAGTHTLTAVATDTAGNPTTSAPVQVTVNNTAPPTVLLGVQTVGNQLDSDSAGVAEAFRTTATATGTLTKLRVYVDTGSAATTLVAGIYAASGSHPGTLLAQASLAAPAAGAWNELTLPSVSITNGTTYWIAVLGRGGTLRFRDKIGGAAETSSSSSLTALPATWATGASWGDGPLSAYGLTG